MKKPARRPGGFSLIETVVALVMLAISIVGGVVVLAASRRIIVQANFARLATWSAVYQVEHLKTVSFDYLLFRADQPPETEPLAWATNATRTTEITRFEALIDNLLAVRVEVDWGGPAPMVLETLLAGGYDDE